jgi:hypothetical protein
MGVIIQEIVGRRHGTRFYPTISGVGRSFNHYPVRYMKSEDGVALVALGLGHSVVLGRAALQFCPRAPGLLPQFRAPRDFALHGQSEFYAVDLGRNLTDFLSGPESSLALLALDAAEQDGTLATVGSVYSEQEDQVRDDLSLPGTRVVTFNNILRWKAYPLAAALDALLEALQSRMGCPVEIEFAADLPALGQPGAELYVLQVRPQLAHLPNVPLRLEEFEPGEVLCHTPSALGHGFIGSIRDVLYVKAEGLDWNTTPDAAREVGQVNARLLQERATCLLLGPGRWGTSDPRLGVPVEWSDITAARVIVEFAFHGRPVEPSQGAHFFHNIITARIGYLTVLPPDQTDGDTLLDLEWLNRQPAVRETERIRHIRLDSPLRIYLDGIAGRATVLKPKS